jgi:hypothetical protein
MAPGSVPDNPTVCWLPSAGADRSICGPGTTNWMYPNGGYLITEEVGPDGKIRVTFRTLPLLPGPWPDASEPRRSPATMAGDFVHRLALFVRIRAKPLNDSPQRRLRTAQQRRAHWVAVPPVPYRFA